MTYDVAAVRACFPALEERTAHFDGPGGAQVPDMVAAAMASALLSSISNRDRSTRSGRRADNIVIAARRAVADLVGGEPAGIVFGRSMTALTYDMARTLAKEWRPGDEVIVTRLDHDANVRPWVQAAAAVGAVVRWVDFDPETGELPAAAFAAAIGTRTRLAAVTGASNLIGTRPDTAEIARLVHGAGAYLYVDGVHLAAHAPIDLSDLGADFFVCSPYKWLGPHCGVLAADPGLLQELHPDKLLASTDDVPERFELGTLPYEILAGVAAAVDFIAGLGELAGAVAPGKDRRTEIVGSMAVVEAHEDRLRRRIEDAVAGLGGIQMRSRAGRRTPTLLLTFDRLPADDVAGRLAGEGVNAPAGSFYAIEASRHMGLGDAGGLRVGVAPYTDDDDVDRLLTGLAGIQGTRRKSTKGPGSGTARGL
ncbi:MAG TPA: cysteine desulfurase-like protein [Acidimicrobiales bacterium]|jgi:cysteine desulfurase family protein (TIGR01976 family)|nr:cysteine desulfurase-like protein [Acidimicrobiales bacterium]